MKGPFVLRTLVGFATTFLLATAAHAQLFRAYLASDGNDANPCTLVQPCRLLPKALAAVASGGEIWMLDSANYNTASVTIGKSVSIQAVPGAIGSVLAIGGPAVQVLANDLKVSLRNIVIAPFPGGSGTNGVTLAGESSMTIEHSQITGVPADGVFVTGWGSVKIANTTIKGAGLYGVRLINGAHGDISSVLLLDNQEGAVAAVCTGTAVARATISDSVISGGAWGVRATCAAYGGTATAHLTRSTVSMTGPGCALGASSTLGYAAVSVAGSTIAENTCAFNVGAGGVVYSSGNNMIVNSPNVIGSLTSLGLH